MSKREKLLARLRSRPKDFTWDDLISVLKHHDCSLEKGTGSRRRFVHRPSGKQVALHEPHPGNIVKMYVVDLVIEFIDALEDDDVDDDL